ncbi:Chemotaxis response regulator protein-glutamate methylesterase CheB [hydrothermal vent metagenome]|uniref:protein-glutamate methylesterase n=1 Tax=hydrothermal vent metagenome TaxID=652676 RepID=A0A3B0ZD93_9ZZZZ
MTVRVLVVDDSGFFRRRLTEMLNSDKHIDVVGCAADGAEAIIKMRELRPDVITMDVEMPVMDGIMATKKIMAELPTPILMFSSLTTSGAKSTFDALDAGALDFLPKKIDDISRDLDIARRLLCARVRVLGARGLATKKPLSVTSSGTLTASSTLSTSKRDARLDLKKIKLIAIGTSTGGPVALQKVLTVIPANFPVPVIIIQHMPASFTPSFAERLDSLCKIKVKQADHGDEVKPGVAYIAPGGVQMMVDRCGNRLQLKIEEAKPDQTYRPSVDITFSSLARVCSSELLAMVLTGMGADGREGARLLKQRGATIWAQDEQSCVVYGMPMAIVDANLADEILSLDKISSLFGGEG